MSRARQALVLARRTVKGAAEDRIVGHSAEVAFFTLLAIPPMLLVLAGFAGYVSAIFGPEVSDGVREWVLRSLGGFLAPETMSRTVGPAVDAIFAEGRGGVISVGAVVAVWSASRLIRVLIQAMNVAYDVPSWRPGWKRRLIALGLTVGGLVVVALFLPLLVAGPRLGPAIDERLGLGGVLGAVWRVAYWPGAVAVAVALLATLYHIAPNWQTRWRRDLPGAILAAAGWLVGAVALRLYVRYTISDESLGPLAAPVVLLLWFYVSSFVVLLGAELNAEIEKMWPTRESGPRDLLRAADGMGQVQHPAEQRS
ncbi:MAG TPA: YihY/virulence factor BrkB family protein [Actinomycetota bacterium]|nr:YihY/virulence factor BrkB family protein [Actinomycetota bacterium]